MCLARCCVQKVRDFHCGATKFRLEPSNWLECDDNHAFIPATIQSRSQRDGDIYYSVVWRSFSCSLLDHFEALRFSRHDIFTFLPLAVRFTLHCAKRCVAFIFPSLIDKYPINIIFAVRSSSFQSLKEYKHDPNCRSIKLSCKSKWESEESSRESVDKNKIYVETGKEKTSFWNNLLIGKYLFDTELCAESARWRWDVGAFFFLP